MALRSLAIGASVASLLTGGALAAPQTDKGPPPGVEPMDEKKACPNMPALDDDDAKAKIWDDDGLGVGSMLDVWVDKHGSENWINNMDQRLGLDSGGSKFWCNGWEANCDEKHDCTDYNNNFVPELYWVKTAVNSHWHFMSNIHEHLQDETIDDTLSIPDIVTRFGDPPKDDTNVLAIMTSVLVMASAAGVGSPVVSAAFASVIGSSGLAGQFLGDTDAASYWIDSTKDVSDQLKGAFKAYRALLEDTVSLAATGKTVKDTKLKSGDLPGDAKYKTGVADYFAHGRWLIGDVVSATKSFNSAMDQRLKQAMVIGALKKNNYILFIDSSKSEDDCNSDGEFSSKWVDGECIDFWYIKDHGGAGEDTDDEIEFMKSDDGGKFDFEEMYHNALDCARNNPDKKGKVNADKMPTDGSVPECFFNLGVYKGTANWEDVEGRYWLSLSEGDPINTTIMSDKSGDDDDDDPHRYPVGPY